MRVTSVIGVGESYIDLLVNFMQYQHLRDLPSHPIVPSRMLRREGNNDRGILLETQCIKVVNVFYES